MKVRTIAKMIALTTLSALTLLNAAPGVGGDASRDIQVLFEGKRAYDHAATLVAIGKRVTGGPLEHLAAAYIAAEMESYGLRVEIQKFPLTYFEDFGSVLAVAGGPALNPRTMYYSPAGEFVEEILYCGLGLPEDFAGIDVSGKIALMRRGAITYATKVANAAERGAKAVVVFNSAPEIMNATLGAMAAIPAVSLSGDEGAQLLELLAAGPVTVRFLVDSVHYDSFSQNIVGTRPGTDPDAGIVYLGAHYDSVWFGPGANDNASGMGCLLEAARVLSAKGHSTKATIKFIAFGAEEPGMIGSEEYVIGNLEEVTARGLGMVNLDMLGVGETLLLGNMGMADSTLAIYAQEKAARMGIENWQAAEMFPNSDHAYFELVGVPAVRLEQSPDPWYHSAEDSMDKIDPAILEANGELATAVVCDWAKNPGLRARKALALKKALPATGKALKFQKQ